MKKYRKNPTKLLQIRLSKVEYNEITKLIKRFGVTRREWLLTVNTHLAEMNIIREGKFYPRHHDYAYQLSHKWDKQLRDDSQCEICLAPNTYDEEGRSKLNRHHQDGYEGENAFKVRILCKRCHGIIHGKELVGKPWDEVKAFVSTYKTNAERERESSSP